jgi:hypothetical protein
VAIKAPVEDVPEGNAPDAVPRFGHLLAEAWQAVQNDAYAHTKSRTDVEHYVRLGWAGQCARKIGYQLLEVEPSNPADLAATWRMSLGTLVHEGLQAAIVAAYPGAEVEKIVGAEHDETFGFPVSGRSDVYLVSDTIPETGEEKHTLIEIKTINGFGFKKAIGARGVAEGPKSGALYQAGLNARAHGADEIVLLYLSLECLSQREADKLPGDPAPERKFLAEWTYTAADLAPLIDEEIVRLRKIVKMADEIAYVAKHDGSYRPKLPPRSVPLEMPKRARIVDAAKGIWHVEVDGNIMDHGSYWGCGYCDHQSTCIQDGPS